MPVTSALSQPMSPSHLPNGGLLCTETQRREQYVSELRGLEVALQQEVEGIEGGATALTEVSGPAEAVGMGAVEATAAAMAVVTVGQAGEGRHGWWRNDESLGITTDCKQQAG